MTEASDLDALLVRATRPDDLASLTAIYAQAVLDGTGTFEIEPLSVEEMGARYARVLACGYPHLVAEKPGRVVGFAYASAYHARAAYRYTVEDSVYVAEGGRGQGVGQALLAALIEQATAGGARQMVAVIGDRENHASIRLHERAGFASAGRLDAVGWKAGRWLDVVLMQRVLGIGGARPPT